MTTEVAFSYKELLSELQAIPVGGFSAASDLNEKAKQYIQLYGEGKLSSKECQDLLQDIDVQGMVATTALQMQVKQFFASTLMLIIGKLGNVPGSIILPF